MAITHTKTSGMRSNNGSFTIPTLSQTVEAEHVVDVTIAVSQTNKQIAFTADTTTMSTFMLYVTGGALTVKTNSSGSPVQTWALDAGDAVGPWFSSDVQANPVTTSITTLYVTNASSTVTPRLVIVLGNDATP